MTLTIRVHGLPAPQGSKRHVGNGVMIESSKRVKPWRQDVRAAALEALRVGPEDEQGMAERIGFPFGPSAVRIDVRFLLPRPKHHYRTGRNANLLRDAAPLWPAVKPDVDKLIRSTLDALGEAGVWRDDSQVVSIHAWKSYADATTPGAVITIEPMGERP